jgi:hypothetical protein
MQLCQFLLLKPHHKIMENSWLFHIQAEILMEAAKISKKIYHFTKLL